MSDLTRWYKDRDFPEVKSSNADIVAIIEKPEQLQRVIDEHNDLVESIFNYQSEIRGWKNGYKNLLDIHDKTLTDRNNELKILRSHLLSALGVVGVCREWIVDKGTGGHLIIEAIRAYDFIRDKTNSKVLVNQNILESKLGPKLSDQIETLVQEEDE